MGKLEKPLYIISFSICVIIGLIGIFIKPTHTVTVKQHISETDSLETISKTFLKCADALDKSVSYINQPEADRKEFQEAQIRFLDSSALYSNLAKQAIVQ
jgi:hypothetical protein